MTVECWFKEVPIYDSSIDKSVKGLYLKVGGKDWEEWFPYNPYGEIIKTQIDSRLVCAALSVHDRNNYGLTELYTKRHFEISDRAYKILKKWVKKRVGKFKTKFSKYVFDYDEIDKEQRERNYIEFSGKSIKFHIDFLVHKFMGMRDSFDKEVMGDSKNVTLGEIERHNHLFNLTPTDDLRVFETEDDTVVRADLHPDRFYALKFRRDMNWLAKRLEREKDETVIIDSSRDPYDTDSYVTTVKPSKACYSKRNVQNGCSEINFELTSGNIMTVELEGQFDLSFDLAKEIVIKSKKESPVESSAMEKNVRKFNFEIDRTYRRDAIAEIYRYSKHTCNLAILTYFWFIFGLTEKKRNRSV